MKIPFVVTMVTLLVVAVMLCAINRQNDFASFGQKSFGFQSFNFGSPQKSEAIMAYWKKKPEKVDAIKTIIKIDYAFMFVYCLYLCFSINYYRKRSTENRRWLKTWLTIALALIIAGTAIDAIQDFKIYHYLNTEDAIGDMRYFTYPKWAALILGIIPLFIAVLPRDIISWAFIGRSIRFLSQLLKSVWVFFPGILMLILPIFCFWMLGQGKDIIVAFIDNRPSGNSMIAFNYFRLIFFIAIGFWAYVSWFSSRIISYIKKKQQIETQLKAGDKLEDAERDYEANKDYFDIGKSFLDGIPRLIGNACFLILELAVLQSPVLYTSMTAMEAWLFFFIAMYILWHVNKWISIRQNAGKNLEDKKYIAERQLFKKTFYVLLIIFLVLVIITSFYDFTNISIWTLFALLIVLHVVYVFYINLRRVELEKIAPDVKEEVKAENKEKRGLLKKLMDYFCVPRKEIGYFRWFLGICAGGIVFYLLAICWLGFARGLGPFPSIILAFGVLLMFGNIVTAFSVKYKLNFHFLLFVLALLFGLKETHEVRTVSLNANGNQYKQRPDLKTYLNAWLQSKNLQSDSCYDMYFIMSNGGASRSGYWTAAVLGKIEDSTLVNNKGDRFSDHVFCLSGTSGGGVGVATFFSLLRNKTAQTKPWYQSSAKAFLKQDYFTYTFARMLGPDFFNYIFHVSATQDRAAALESSFETSSMEKSDSSFPVPFADPLSSFPAMNNGHVQLPILFVNTTRMQDGSPGVVSNLNITLNNDVFNKRVDVVKLLDSGSDISITSAAVLGARFPYLSPAGRIANDYFVDGGYFDNSGAGVVQEMIRGIIKIGKEDTSGVLMEKIRRLNFKILHIVNSPVGFESVDMSAVAPIINDLMSPILTIGGAYNKQTTVNDGRLTNYIEDVNRHEANRASYTQISLYESPAEWRANTELRKRFRVEPAYAMNWFMSDTTLSRINKRIVTNKVLDSVIAAFGNTTLIKQ